MEPPTIDGAQLAELEGLVRRALGSGSTDGLGVLGYGEITLVLGWPAVHPRVACKRLPVFDDERRARAYGSLIHEYVGELKTRGIRVLPTEWRTTPTDGARVAGYVVQPVLPPDSLAPRLVADDGAGAPELLASIVEQIVSVVDPRIGLDAQLSNWAVLDGELHYFDVTTPLLADATGRTRLDLDLLTSPLPAAIRPIVRRAVAPGLVAAYHRPRDVAVDLVGNLLKERLEHAVTPAIERANARLSPPITRTEIDRWYRSDARTWDALLRLRRADRWWQRRVRRRVYPFLLPGPIRR
jgi:hypothetical protein